MLKAMNFGCKTATGDGWSKWDGEVITRYKIKQKFGFLLWLTEPFVCWRRRANRVRDWESRNKKSLRKAGTHSPCSIPADCQAGKAIQELPLSELFSGPDLKFFSLRNHCQQVLDARRENALQGAQTQSLPHLIPTDPRRMKTVPYDTQVLSHL